MKFIDTEYLTYDDVLLVPQYSSIDSRQDIDIGTSGHYLELKNPFIAANMDTVTEENMVIAMHNLGGAAMIHRFLKPDRLEQIIKRCKAAGADPIPSIGVNGDGLELLSVALDNGVKFICIDVAHGDHKKVVDRIKDVADSIKGKNVKIIAGNVATADGFENLAKAGAHIIKVGVGPGSHCTTRIVTGHGVPQLSAITSCVAIANKYGVDLIADGGIKNSGDIAKALAAGAHYVMIGRLFAGTDESPGNIVSKNGNKFKSYRGMASYAAQSSIGKNRVAEGVSTLIPYKGSVKRVVDDLAGGLRSALSYTAASNLPRFREKAIMIRVSSSSKIENGPHGAI